MNCDFVKSLTTEQKELLRKELNKAETTPPKYRVEVEFWDVDKTKIRYLREYLDDQLHGVSKYWHPNGLSYECHYENGKRHGVSKGWHPNGQLEYENHYENGVPTVS